MFITFVFAFNYGVCNRGMHVFSAFLLVNDRRFLGDAGLAQYVDALVENGYSDLDTLCDQDVLDDDTLAKVIKMTKPHIRQLRSHIASKAAATGGVSRKGVVSKTRSMNKAMVPGGAGTSI